MRPRSGFGPGPRCVLWMRWSGCDSDDQFPEVLTGEQAHKGLGCVRKAVNDVLAVPHLPGLDARGNIRKKMGNVSG